ncbi:ubiquinol oxidase subunit II [Phenylobacterium sp.]|uniref:ubiquinol oxidase subunit II n=1 Tax=Phenylobacterium sp. TaxID=1871053 RepID=UPI001212DC8B|nr:ubiquinol oxidase subunit II [Phenylobacterium sp.]THD59283.1 MAG: ubiquinol oxidase subunit II [Phenylobacterium sp.]
MRTPPRFKPLARRGWVLLASWPLGGCGGVLDPQGPVGAAEKLILLNSLGIMLAIVVPTILATLGVAWWFRASNRRAVYRPDWEYSGRIELVVWAIPAMTVLLLGGIGWAGSHLLDPAKALASSAAPLEVDVVALDWKWLFIYPEQGVASVNRLVAPVGRPISLRLTSATVMDSFFVPQLGTQIYAMPGMTTRLNLQADRLGRFPGLSAMFSGDGFSRMSFVFDALPDAQFQAWAAAAKAQGPALDAAGYQALARPSQGVAPTTYSAVAPGLFDALARTQTPPPPAGAAVAMPTAMEP